MFCEAKNALNPFSAGARLRTPLRIWPRSLDFLTHAEWNSLLSLPFHLTPQPPPLYLKKFSVGTHEEVCRHPSLGVMQHLTKLDLTSPTRLTLSLTTPGPGGVPSSAIFSEPGYGPNAKGGIDAPASTHLFVLVRWSFSSCECFWQIVSNSVQRTEYTRVTQSRYG